MMAHSHTFLVRPVWVSLIKRIELPSTSTRLSLACCATPPFVIFRYVYIHPVKRFALSICNPPLDHPFRSVVEIEQLWGKNRIDCLRRRWISFSLDPCTGRCPDPRTRRCRVGNVSSCSKMRRSLLPQYCGVANHGRGSAGRKGWTKVVPAVLAQ